MVLDQFQDEIEADPYLRNHLMVCPSRIRAAVEDHHEALTTIVDFGCGHGIKAIAIAHAYPNAHVVGVDITDAFKRAIRVAERVGGMPQNLTFRQIWPGDSIASVVSPDLIYSWSVMEHIPRKLLPEVIHDIYRSLRPGGVCFTQIAPLFYSPFGSHLREFCDEPWAHVSMSHDELRKVVLFAEKDGATGTAEWMFERFEELNKVTADELARYFSASGFASLKDVRRRADTKIPDELLDSHSLDALQTFELLFIHRKNYAKEPYGTSKTGFHRAFAALCSAFRK